MRCKLSLFALFCSLLTDCSRRSFRVGRTPILVATGISARGWDIKDIKHVINFDLPSKMYGGIQEYIHRIGRTARIGHQGLATSFYNDRDDDLGQDLVNVLVECDCAVPEFLQQYVPEDGKVDFDDDTDEEGEAGDQGGSGFGEAAEGGAPVASAWGAEAPAEGAGSGFSADAGFTAAAGSGW